MIFSFAELLLIFFFLAFALILYLLHRSSEASEDEPRIKCSPKFSKLLFRVHCALVLSVFILAVYSIWFGSRPIEYFVFVAGVFVTSVLSVSTKPKEKTGFTILFTLVLLSLISALTPIAENRGIIFGSDQWRDLVATKLIGDQGTIWNAAAYSGNYYSLIPSLSVLTASISLITGNVYFSFMVPVVGMSIIMTISIYLILLKLTRTHIASVIGVFTFLATARLSIVQALPTTISMALGSLLILTFIRHISVHNRYTLASIVLLALAALIFHPVGIIVILVFSGGLAIVHFVGLFGNNRRQFNLTSSLFALFSIMAFTYWTLSNSVFISLVVPAQRVLTSLFTYSPSVYAPNYFAGGSATDAFAWALPIGIAGAYVIVSIGGVLMRRRDHYHRRGLHDPFMLVAAVAGLFLVGIGFISILHSPGASVERYLSEPAYLLILLASAMVGAYVIKSKGKLGFFCMLLVLSCFVFAGSSSPDWAPFEHVEFAAIRTTYASYVEARTLTPFLPNSVYIYEDNDIAVTGVAAMANISSRSPESFQTTRDVLTHYKNGEFIPFDPEYRDALFIIKLGEITNATVFNMYINVLYNSGRHIALENPIFTP